METTDIKFIDAEYRPLLLQRMNSFRESKKLADIRLVIDGKEILAHKVIVGMWSPWIFDKLNENELIEMDYECGSYEAVSTIIDYMYTGEMRFSLENVVRICRNLDILQMHSVSAVLQEYLTQSINIGNCTEILLVAEYRPLLLQRMNSFRESKKLTDIRLLIDGKEIFAHKVIVGMWSPWIFDKLNDNELIEMDYECGSYEAVSTIIDYIYTGEMCFSLGNVVQIWRNLHLLQMHSVLTVLQKYLMQSINIENCTEILLIADILRGEDLKNAALACIVKNFKTLTTLRRLAHLDENLIKTIITASVGSNSAQLIYEVVIDWLKFREGRKGLIEEMLKFVKVDGISNSFLAETISHEQYLKEENAGRKWIVESFFTNKYSIRRLEKILNIFSMFPPDSFIYELNVDCNKLMQRKQWPALWGDCIARHKNAVYVLGGERNRRGPKIGLTFDLLNKKWNDFSCSFDKSCSGICLIDDKFYLIGGKSAHTNNMTADCYILDIEKGFLLPMQKLQQQRVFPAVAVHSSSIYAIGGSFSNTVERFDPREGFWSKLESTYAKGYHSAVSIGNAIYFLASDYQMIEYDVRSQKESRFLDCPFDCRSLALLDEKLYIGHCDGIARFNFQDYCWTDLVEHPLGRPFLIA